MSTCYPTGDRGRTGDRPWDTLLYLLITVGIYSLSQKDEVRERHWAMGIGLWAMGYGLWAMGIGLWAMGYGHWAILTFLRTAIAILASFVNFLLPPLTKGSVGVGEKIYDSCKDCYVMTNIQGNIKLKVLQLYYSLSNGS